MRTLKTERQFFEMYEDAQCMPDSSNARDPQWVVDRLHRYGETDYSLKDVRRIIEAYENRPHRCSIRTMHSFGKPCALGVDHPGCCPGCGGRA